MHSGDRSDDGRPSFDDLAGPDAPAALAALRAHSPIAWVPAIDAWLVTGHEAAVQVMRDDETFTVDDPRFSTARITGPSMLSRDGAAHRRHRSPFVAPFRPRQVNDRFATTIDTLTDGLLDRIRPDGQADLRTALAGPLSVAVVADALGLQDVDVDTMLDWYRHIVAAVSQLTGTSPVPADAARAMGALAEQLQAGLRSTHPSVLRDAAAELPETEIVANAAVMMFGGIETTEGMILNALLHLLRDPETRAAVAANPVLADVAVEESLRLEPAAGAVDRYATRDVVLAGARIRARDLVRVSLTAANRDPDVFAEPDRYDLSRTNLRRQLSFAHGPHVCIAADLARLEARTAVVSTLRALPGLHLARPVDATGHVFRKPQQLFVMWSP